jgi:hypothetical protein
MRFARRRLACGAAAFACALSACGTGDSPTAPEMPTVTVATGPQVLRLTYQGNCTAPDGRPLVPLVYVRVVVTRGGNEWVGTAATPDAGDIELRFHASGRVVIAGSMPVAGTIKGTAIHNPDLVPTMPPSTTRVNFGADGRTGLNGFAFSPSALTPATGVSGVGSGTVTVSDSDGRSCAGTAFAWGLGPQA